MKYTAIIIFSFLSLSLMGQAEKLAIAQAEAAKASKAETTEGINWMTWDEANAANKITPKKVFIDIYTDWCGWCKKMDKSTFQNAEVIEALNKDFYAVKFDAEQKGDILFNGAEFKWKASGRKGTHQLAYALLDGKMGYPAFVMLDENFHRVMLSPGFKKSSELLTELSYTSTDAYKTENFKDYNKK